MKCYKGLRLVCWRRRLVVVRRGCWKGRRCRRGRVIRIVFLFLCWVGICRYWWGIVLKSWWRMMDLGFWGYILFFFFVCCNCSKLLFGIIDLWKKFLEGVVWVKVRRRGVFCVEGLLVFCFFDWRFGLFVFIVVYFLGGEFVVWKDLEGEWRVFLDKCLYWLVFFLVSKLDFIFYLLCWDVWSFCFCDCMVKLGYYFEVWGFLIFFMFVMVWLV